MPLKLYDLAGADPALRFSPYCWRTKLALHHKGLDFETVPWRFTEKDLIAFSGQERVPLLVDGETIVADSLAIAIHLEETYPDRPSLFGGAEGLALTRFVNHWVDGVINLPLLKLVLVDIAGQLAEQDRDYFRRSREARFGMTIEQVSATRDTDVVAVRQLLQPVRAMLGSQPYLAGAAPRYADFILFGNFLTARSVSEFPILEPDDPVAQWRERMLYAFEPLVRISPGHPMFGANG